MRNMLPGMDKTTGRSVPRLGPRQRFIVDLPDDLAEEVRRFATEGRRPLNSQFALIVEQWLREVAAKAAA